MSTLKVDAIRHNSATSDAITTAADGTCTAKLTSVGGGQLSHRNIIINGAMQVAQRATTYTGANPFTTVDRFRLNHTGLNEDCTTAQADVASGTTPYTLGFRKAFKITNGNHTAGAGAGDRIAIQYRIEAQDVANSGWNYVSSSSNITLQFWVKSSVAQNFYGRLYTSDGTSQNYPFETGSLSADTWTKITKTIPGNSNLTFDNDNGRGLDVEFTLFRGTNETGSVTLNQWAAFNSGTYTPDNTSTWYTTNDATFELTGVQLEVGDTATSFEHRSHGEEFERCQRYYQQYVNISAVGYVPDNSSRSYSHAVPLPVAMRSGPTMSITNTGSSNGQMISDGDTNRYISSLLSQGSKTTHMSASFNLTGDLANFRGAYLIGTTNTTSQTTYKLDAEL